MKETGLMFKAPLVRAILSGQKTQTRRMMKLNFNDSFSYMQTNLPNAYNEIIEFREQEGTWFGLHGWNELCSSVCPMGQPGDRIYVRETWNPDPPCDGTWGYTAWAGCRLGQIEGVPEQFRSPKHCMYEADSNAELAWTPSIHMPKWAARIWLEITGVRVERLQSISEQDAIAEGIERTEDFFGCPCWRDYSEPEGPDAAVCPDDPIGSFQTLWESTGGDWAENPWVWVIDFKTISTTGRPA